MKIVSFASSINGSALSFMTKWIDDNPKEIIAHVLQGKKYISLIIDDRIVSEPFDLSIIAIMQFEIDEYRREMEALVFLCSNSHNNSFEFTHPESSFIYKKVDELHNRIKELTK